MVEIALTQTPAHVRHGSSIGQPLTRRDGVLKVTGAAKYAADHHPPGMLYAVLAVSSIARGRVAFLDVAAAKAHPGVVEVITPANRPVPFVMVYVSTIIRTSAISLLRVCLLLVETFIKPSKNHRRVGSPEPKAVR